MGSSSDRLSACLLEGRWGSLRPLSAARDAHHLYELTHGFEVAATWQEMKVGPFPTEPAFVEHVAELIADPFRAFFAVAGRDGEALGWLCLMEAHNSHKSVELGYVLFSPLVQRTTLATEVYFLILSHVFETLGYQRLEWTCTASNARSYHSAARLGFRFEGVMRRKLILKGVAKDIAMFSLLGHEWPERREAIRIWLDPGNFYQGRQLSSLMKPDGIHAPPKV